MSAYGFLFLLTFLTSLRPSHQQNVTANQTDQFNKVVVSLMNEAAEEASSSPRKLAYKMANYTSSQTVYVLVQCTSDLTTDNCSSCLQQIIKKLLITKAGARNVWWNCTLRYELYPFSNETLTSLPSPPRQALPPPLQFGKGTNTNSMVIIIATVVPLAVYVLLFAVVSSFHVATRAKKTYETAAADGDDITTAAHCSLILELSKLQLISFQKVTNSVKADLEKFTRYIYKSIELPD